MRNLDSVLLLLNVLACSSSAADKDDGAPSEQSGASGVNHCTITVSNLPSAEPETYEMGEVDFMKAPVTADEKDAWNHSVIATWRATDGTLSCIFSEDALGNGQLRNRVVLDAHIKGKPPLTFDESTNDGSAFQLSYLSPKGSPRWLCEVDDGVVEGTWSAQIDSVKIVGSTANGLYGRSLVEGSFEASCPPHKDPSLEPVSIKGVFSVVPREL